jgi:hypothetical protein
VARSRSFKRRRQQALDRLLGALGVAMIVSVLAAVAYLLWPEQIGMAAAALPRIARSVVPVPDVAPTPDGRPISRPPG